MQPIPLRSADVVKRIATEEVRPLLPEAWSHRTVLDVTAALYGYDHWAHLRRTAHASTHAFVFDQDLAPEALDGRRLELARHVEQRTGIPFPYAYGLVARSAVTRDFRRERPQTLETTALFETLRTHDAWWYIDRDTADYSHPLVPAGFALCRATRLAEMARVILWGREELPENYSMSSVVMPAKRLALPFALLSAHLFLPRQQILHIKPIPFAHMMPRAYRLRLRDLIALRHLGAGDDRKEWTQRLIVARDHYAKLANAARLSAEQARKLEEPLGVRARDELGVPWCWPLELQHAPQDDVATAFERIARTRSTLRLVHVS
jgi:hypothetical protein